MSSVVDASIRSFSRHLHSSFSLFHTFHYKYRYARGTRVYRERENVKTRKFLSLVRIGATPETTRGRDEGSEGSRGTGRGGGIVDGIHRRAFARDSREPEDVRLCTG